jgi:hypothetical protein
VRGIRWPGSGGKVARVEEVVGIRLMEAEGCRTMAEERRDIAGYISTWTTREED